MTPHVNRRESPAHRTSYGHDVKVAINEYKSQQILLSIFLRHNGPLPTISELVPDQSQTIPQAQVPQLLFYRPSFTSLLLS
jgi:hypothetical protein